MMYKVTLITAVRKAEASGGSTEMQGTTGIQGRRRWATQGTKSAAVGCRVQLRESWELQRAALEDQGTAGRGRMRNGM